MKASPEPTAAVILGVRVAAVDTLGAVERVAQMVAAGGHHHVVTVNPEFLVMARYHPPFRAVLQRAALATADGAGVVLAAPLYGTPLRGRVPGSDLVVALSRRAARDGWRVFLLGAAPGVAEKAAAALCIAAPGLQVVGAFAGSPHDEHAPDILSRLALARPDLLLVAYGAPSQDLWLAHHLRQTSAAVGIGVGGSFDFLAGQTPRAPLLMRQGGLEWLYRLWRQPWRARRMLALPAFVALVVRDVLARRLLGLRHTVGAD
ncbi:MAG TPA: WecB/TagA/CpsF family glycosyltransferase [Chloroflexota bacterium]|nr:WecB/TagA/CpsF family glycosyltransferase [Chloroflexota bacterium]